jgi:hypothetical protein
MIANALFAAAIFMLALVFFLLTQLRFLIPYRPLLPAGPPCPLISIARS